MTEAREKRGPVQAFFTICLMLVGLFLLVSVGGYAAGRGLGWYDEASKLQYLEGHVEPDHSIQVPYVTVDYVWKPTGAWSRGPELLFAPTERLEEWYRNRGAKPDLTDYLPGRDTSTSKSRRR